MQFTEDEEWQTVPEWATYLIQVGYQWCGLPRSPRFIGIISMPCDSAGAGLVSLGAIRRRLELREANDSLSHFDRVKMLAANRNEEIFIRHPKHGLCRLDGHCEIAGQDSLVWAELTVRRGNQPRTRVTINASEAGEWKLEGEAPIKAVPGKELRHRAIYEHLIDQDRPLVPANCTGSDSGICLATRTSGANSSLSIFSEVKLRLDPSAVIAGLPDLMSVQGWSAGFVSRLTIFNSRIGKMDRSVTAIRFVAIDGDTAFLRVIDREEFRNSHLLAVFNRVVERDRLEAVQAKIVDLAQWYEPVHEAFPEPPLGLSACALRRRLP